MRKLPALAAGALLLSMGSTPAVAKLDPEARLARELEGRVAGEPVQCLNLRNVRSSRIIDRTAILYEVGSTIYVNRPRGGAESLDGWDTLVVKPHAAQLCRVDVVRLYDTSSRMQTGVVFLGDFVPYKKVRD